MRFRHLFIGMGSILVILALVFSDPDSGYIENLTIGAGAISIVINLAISVLYIGLLHLSRKALIDYVDFKTFFKKALQSSEGAGMAIIGIGLIMVSISIVITAATS
jgi:hypothetical protein